MGAIYSWQQTAKESGLGSNKRFGTTNYVAGQDTQDQLVQPPEGYYLPYFIVDFNYVLTNSATTSATPASTVAGATTDVMDLFVSRLELKDAIGGQQRTQVTNRVDIEEMERLAFNYPLYSVPYGTTSATFAAYNLPGSYPRPAPGNVPGSGSLTIQASLRVPFGSDNPGEGCFVVMNIPALTSVYATGVTGALTVTFREAYHPSLKGAWAFQTVKPNVFSSGIQDVAPNVPQNMSPYLCDFTHATVTTTSGVSTNTFTQSLFQAPGLNRLQDNAYSIIESNMFGYPDVANPLPNYGTVANCVSDVVPFSIHGKRPSIWNLNVAANSTQLDMLFAGFTGHLSPVPPSPPMPTTTPDKAAQSAGHVPNAGPAGVRSTANMTLGAMQLPPKLRWPTGGRWHGGRKVA